MNMNFEQVKYRFKEEVNISDKSRGYIMAEDDVDTNFDLSAKKKKKKKKTTFDPDGGEAEVEIII